MKIDSKKFKGLCTFKRVSAKEVKIENSDFILSGNVQQTSKNYYKVNLLLRGYRLIQEHAHSQSEAEQIIFNHIAALKRKYSHVTAGNDVLPGQIVKLNLAELRVSAPIGARQAGCGKRLSTKEKECLACKKLKCNGKCKLFKS